MWPILKLSKKLSHFAKQRIQVKSPLSVTDYYEFTKLLWILSFWKENLTLTSFCPTRIIEVWIPSTLHAAHTAVYMSAPCIYIVSGLPWIFLPSCQINILIRHCFLPLPSRYLEPLPAKEEAEPSTISDAIVPVPQTQEQLGPSLKRKGHFGLFAHSLSLHIGWDFLQDCYLQDGSLHLCPQATPINTVLEKGNQLLTKQNWLRKQGRLSLCLLVLFGFQTLIMIFNAIWPICYTSSSKILILCLPVFQRASVD